MGVRHSRSDKVSAKEARFAAPSSMRAANLSARREPEMIDSRLGTAVDESGPSFSLISFTNGLMLVAPELNTWLWPRFVDDVEGRFGGTAEASEAGRGDDVSDARFAGLRAEAQSNFLRARRWRAKQSREAVINAADRIEIVLELVVGKGLDDHPGAVFGERLKNVLSRTDGIAHIVQAIEDRNEVVSFPGKFLGGGHIEADAIGEAVAFSGCARAFDGLVVIIEAEEMRFGKGLGH